MPLRISPWFGVRAKLLLSALLLPLNNQTMAAEYDLSHVVEKVSPEYRDDSWSLKSVDMGKMYGLAFACMKNGHIPMAEYLDHSYMVNGLIGMNLIDENITQAAYVAVAHYTNFEAQDLKQGCLSGFGLVAETRSNIIRSQHNSELFRFGNVRSAVLNSFDADGNATFDVQIWSNAENKTLPGECMVNLVGRLVYCDIQG